MINRYKPRYNIQLKNTAKVAAPIAITIAGKSLILNSRGPVVERRI
jgi:excinuclease UvrABC nuclease subunit